MRTKNIEEMSLPDLLAVARFHKQQWREAEDFPERARAELNYFYFIRVALKKTLATQASLHLDCEFDDPEIFELTIEALCDPRQYDA